MSVLLCASIGGSGVSAADTAAFTDRRSDAPRSIDVRQVTVRNEQRIAVTTTIADLPRSTGAGLAVYFDTRRGDYGPEFAAVGGLGTDTDWQMLRVETWNLRRAKIRFRCDIDLRVSYVRDTATFNIARRCLSRPDRVRVAVSVSNRDARDWAPSRKTFYRSVGR